MRTLAIILGTLAVLIGGPIAWYKLNYPTYVYRFRMIVLVDDNGIERSGASVIEIVVNKQPKFGSAPPQVSRVHGDAVFVDLGTGRNVIALLAAGPNADKVDYPSYVVPAAFEVAARPNWDVADLPKLRGRRDLPDNLLPAFVTFADLNDPKTARVVRPDEFERVFGDGVRLKRVSVEMVPADMWPFTWLGWPPSLAGEPVTKEIERKLPWLQAFKGYFGGPFDPTRSRPARNLTGVEFIRRH